MTYAMPNCTDMICIWNWPGDATVLGPLWGIGIMLAMWIIAFTAYKSFGNGTKDSLIVAGFVTLTVAAILAVLETLAPEYAIIPLVLCAIGFLIPRGDK